MHFHPKDTLEAFKPANKEKISHLWYQLHYNQMEQSVNKKTRDTEYIARKPKLSRAPFISQELLLAAQNVDKQRQQAFADLTSCYHIRQLKAASLSCIIHGMGGENVSDTSLTLHPVYGIPYIPSSSVKGLVRNWFIQAYCDGVEEKLVENEWGSLVFGSQENRGTIQFHDIFLHQSLKIETDILTVHFKNYYSGTDAATDYGQPPNMVSFWAVNVKEANIFLTIQKEQTLTVPVENLLNATVMWTRKAFMELGIGAKTSLGYGLFSEVNDVTNEEMSKIIADRHMQNEKRRKERLKQIQQEEEMRQQQETAARLAAMSKEERLLYEIRSLSENEKDLTRSKVQIYNEVRSEQNAEAAAALKDYWEKTGNWKVKASKQNKQYGRVQVLKKLLE